MTLRLRFLDAARLLAIAMMVLAHARDGLMDAASNGHWLARLHDHTRGYTAPLFFVVSGWAFAVATLPRLRAYQARGPLLRARVERIALLFVLGRLLTLPWWHPDFPFDVPADVWLPFLTSGVLECLAVAMALAHVCVFVIRSPRALLAVFVALTCTAVLAAGPVQAAVAGWPAALRGVFNMDGVPGGFPLFPFAAYFFFGAAFGGLAHARAWSPRRCAVAAALLGAALLALPPTLFLQRAGWTLVVLGAIGLAVERLSTGPLAERLSSRALTFYVAHMLLLWGVPFVPGLVHRTQHTFGVGGVLGVTAAMLGSIVCWCVLTERALEEAPRAAEG